ncbi:PEP-CTERM sorting domain-containing protein [Roseateles sp.]|uniref:PEP-CTERM sorting domain-containing protein n=1 Tax=Roseateles sp. TaxID=1971397 RepID=UPI003BA86D9E
MKLATLALALGLSAPAFASTTFTVDFEKSWDYGQMVDASYAASGVTFTNVMGLSNGDGLGSLPDGAYYAGAPSPQGVGFVQLDGVVNTAAYMNVAGGVEGGLRFFYSSPSDVSFAISAYSGLNGTGTLLGTINLTANSADYTTWTQAVLTFGGVAQSFDLTGAANVVGLDNISAVPEPSSVAMLLAGATLLLARRRRG